VQALQHRQFAPASCMAPLLDARILADVYLAMTGGQGRLGRLCPEKRSVWAMRADGGRAVRGAWSVRRCHLVVIAAYGGGALRAHAVIARSH